jgi:multicomponent Na+:H+ antiporter subunit F
MTLEAVVTILILPLLGVGLLVTFIRIVRGPSLPDRVVALDLMATFIIAISAVYSVASNEPSYLDAAVVLALHLSRYRGICLLPEQEGRQCVTP